MSEAEFARYIDMTYELAAKALEKVDDDVICDWLNLDSPDDLQRLKRVLGMQIVEPGVTRDDRKAEEESENGEGQPNR
jgi:hypothetical protein